MLVYVTLPADQTVGAIVTCEFLIGSDIFSREAKLGDFYGNVFCSLPLMLETSSKRNIIDSRTITLILQPLISVSVKS